MAIYGASLWVYYSAWDKSLPGPAVGDAANHTLSLLTHGVAGSPSAAPVEVTSIPGRYGVLLTDAEAQAGDVELGGVSSTPDVDLFGTSVTFDPAPPSDPATISGMLGVQTALTELLGAIPTDKTGYALTSGERTSIAGAVEAAIMNEADGEAVLQAIVNKINATDTDLSGLTLSAIAQAVRDVLLGGAAAGSVGAALLAIVARVPSTGTLATADDIPATTITDIASVTATLQSLLNQVKAATDALALRLPLAGTLAVKGDIPSPVDNADAYLLRDLSQVDDSGTDAIRTPLKGERTLVNKVDFERGIVYKEDDATPSHTFTTTTDAAAEPVTAINPAGGA